MNKPRLASLALALAAAALSFHFSVKAAADMAPSDSWAELCALAAVWEFAKLLLGPKAIMGLMTNRSTKWLGPTGHVASLALVGVLMAGSVGATYVSTRASSGERQQASHAAWVEATRRSPEHRALVDDIDAYSRRIELLQAIATSQLEDNQRTLARRTADDISPLQKEKDAAIARLSHMTMPNPVSSRVPAEHWQWVSVAVAIALEVISVVAFVAFHTESVSPNTATTNAYKTETPLAKQASLDDVVREGIIHPRVRDVMQYAKISQKAAQHMLADMTKRGVVRRNGRRYEVNL